MSDINEARARLAQRKQEIKDSVDLIEDLRCEAEGNYEDWKEDYPHLAKMLHEAADALEAAEQRIAELETTMCNDPAYDPWDLQEIAKKARAEK